MMRHRCWWVSRQISRFNVEVSRLYRQRISTGQLVVLALSGMIALAAALAVTPGGQTVYSLIGARLDDVVSWVRGLVADTPPEALGAVLHRTAV